MLELIFLPFLFMENLAMGLAQSLRVAPPPMIFTQFVKSPQASTSPPAISNFFKASAVSNLEEEEVIRDKQGFIIKRIIKRKVEEE